MWIQIFNEYNDNANIKIILPQINGEWKRMKIGEKNVLSYKIFLKKKLDMYII